MFKKTKLCKGLTLAFGGSMAIAGLPALAQQAAAPAQLDRVEITGSSIKRIEGEGATLVQTLTRQDIDRLGVQTSEELLRTISAMSTASQTQLSSGTGLSTYGFSGVSLRGLGEERTLVLMNGKRLAPQAGLGGAAVNVNGIPLAAIERVEVLKDGASAIYGSDAIAGVVNFIMVKNFEGLQLGGTYGTPSASGGGQNYNVNALFGIGDITKDKYSLTVSAQWQKTEQLFGADRDFAKNGNILPYFESQATGQGNIQGNWEVDASGKPTVRSPGYASGGPAGGFGNPLTLGGDNCAQAKMFLVSTPTSTGVGYCQYDPAAYVGLIPQNESTSYTANFQYQLNQHAEAYVDWYYNRNIVTQAIQESPVRTSFLETDELFGVEGAPGSTARVLLVRPGSAAYTNYVLPWIAANPTLGLDPTKAVGVTARVFDFGPRTSQDTSTLSRLAGGIRGDIWGQDYNIGVYQNTSKLSGSVTDGYFSQLGFAEATHNADWNPWELQQSDAFNAAIAPAKYVGPTLSATARTTNFDATMSGAAYKLPAGEMNYAVGYQYRGENYETNPSEAQFTGDIAGLGGATKGIDVARNINSVFGELQIPIVKNLDANLALRFDDYSDVGGTTNWKANFRWQPTPQWLIRGNYGTGFRAPTLSDLWLPQVLGTSAQFNDPVTGQTDLQVNELSGGNPLLEPETSKSWQLGVVWQPMASLSLGVDYFNTEITNVISTPSTQEIVSQNALGNPAYAGLVVRDAAGNIVATKAILANTGTIEAVGWDITGNYRQNIGPGRLDVGLTGTYYQKYDQSTPGAGTSHKVGTIVDDQGNPVIGADTGGVVLRYKQYMSGTWTQGAWATTLGWSYASGYDAGWDLNGNPTSIGSMNLFDLQVAWTGVKNLSLALGVNNLFGTDPDIFVPVSNQFQTGYDASQYDPRGRFIYLTGTFKF
jgi:iron complex outermembrane receptor protein